jgi:hypothetical protein
MVEIDIWQVVALLAVGVVFAAAVAPYVPPWAGYTIAAGMASYYLVRIILEGFTLARAAVVLAFTITTIVAWRRCLRGTEYAHRQRSPPEK